MTDVHAARLAIFDRFLRDVVDQEWVDPDIAAAARSAWSAMVDASGGVLAVPDVTPGPDDQVFFSWDQDGHCLELEIDAPGHGIFLFVDRNTHDGRSFDWDLTSGLPAGFASILGLFSRQPAA